MTASEPWRTMGHVDLSAHTQDVHTKREGGSALRDKALWVTGLVSEVNAYSILTHPNHHHPLISHQLNPLSLSPGTSTVRSTPQWSHTKSHCYSSFDLSNIYTVKYHLTTRIRLYQLSFLISTIPGPRYHLPAFSDLPVI